MPWSVPETCRSANKWEVKTSAPWMTNSAIHHSEYLRRAANASEKQSNYKAFLQQFVDFVRRADPKVLSTIEALLATRTQGESSALVRITQTDIGPNPTYIIQLA